ncbi:hypothetical protein Btus_1944 [Kyrpidia tusciae DSM 2912]|uniref:Uncharacterized protein n=1 Tax=Kyrpidia tusciae (strain DSM 2912 / NBRC 15312 / T2) TaxID=562970 RepID=D5WQN0_KYRT2|nr:hypothetical protein Btus_1944 [Kyrpidia tusciae DSM 2912]
MTEQPPKGGERMVAWALAALLAFAGTYAMALYGWHDAGRD